MTLLKDYKQSIFKDLKFYFNEFTWEVERDHLENANQFLVICKGIVQELGGKVTDSKIMADYSVYFKKNIKSVSLPPPRQASALPQAEQQVVASSESRTMTDTSGTSQPAMGDHDPLAELGLGDTSKAQKKGSPFKCAPVHFKFVMDCFFMLIRFEPEDYHPNSHLAQKTV